MMRRLVKIPKLPSTESEKFDWPTASKIDTEQCKHEATCPAHLQFKNDSWTDEVGAIWILDNSTVMQLHLCINAHTGPSGHRGDKATEASLQKHYCCLTISSDNTSVRSCIHCRSTFEGGKVPRPFGLAVHGTKPNDLLQSITSKSPPESTVRSMFPCSGTIIRTSVGSPQHTTRRQSKQ